jgi:hypothetical protein
MSKQPVARVGNLRSYDGSLPKEQVIRIDRGSVWGNPFAVGWAMGNDGIMHYRTKEVSIHLYRQLMEQRVKGLPGPRVSKADEHGNRNYGMGSPPTPDEMDAEAFVWIKRLENLAGKLLLCWCSPDPCHGNVLVEMSEFSRTRQYRQNLAQRARSREYKRLDAGKLRG